MEISEENDGNETVNDEPEIVNKVIVEEKVEEPKVGMMFNTTDEVLDYYKKYAKQLGFPVKKRSSSKDDDGVLRQTTKRYSASKTKHKN
ncbi:hypothetical protein BVC80_9083g64 [Macleaya cordata]|uniref:FAR1 DNA binding domain n=1 Tax=Macleaya cordata TaxID=56857 RepID=A0A200PRB7_MACCD|nr:hypothetical protein BVC80_9083g64 [Macleaya cordata]